MSNHPNANLYHFNETVSLSSLSETITERLGQIEAIAMAGSRCQIEETNDDMLFHYFRTLRNSIEEVRFLHERFLDKVKQKNEMII